MTPIGHADQHAAHFGTHGHLAALEDGLDFANTLEFSRGRAVDHLDTIETAVRWLDEHELLHQEMLEAELRRFASDPEAGARKLEQIRRVRAAVRELLDATVEHRPPEPERLRDVNEALRTHYITELVLAPDGVTLGHRHEGDPIAGALARLAESVAREVSQGDADRLRICANDECRWVFKDTSRAGRRKWCDMTTCGNRAKVARHRERQKAEVPATGGMATSPGEA